MSSYSPPRTKVIPPSLVQAQQRRREVQAVQQELQSQLQQQQDQALDALRMVQAQAQQQQLARCIRSSSRIPSVTAGMPFAGR